MNKIHVLSGVACVSVFLATGALAELKGVQPGTSANPKDNVPAEIQRSDPSGIPFGEGGTGPGTRSDALVGEKKEKPNPETRHKLEQNAEKGGGAAMAADDLKEKSRHSGATGASGGQKTDRQMFRQQNSDPAAQGQELINQQPSDKPTTRQSIGECRTPEIRSLSWPAR
jgi:hypothetical protein